MPVVVSSVVEKYIFERLERVNCCEPTVRVFPLIVNVSDSEETEAFTPSVSSNVKYVYSLACAIRVPISTVNNKNNFFIFV